MEDAHLLDASYVVGHMAVVRQDNESARTRPDVARALFTDGPLHFIMKDAASDLVEDVPGDHLKPDGDNLDAASDFSHLIRESGYYREQLAARVLFWAHLSALDWRNGWATTKENLDQLEFALVLLVAERLHEIVTHQQLPVAEQVRQLQEERLRERGEHQQLRRARSAQHQGLDAGRAKQALAKAEKQQRVRTLAKEFPGKSGGDLVLGVILLWRERYPNEQPPSERSIYRYLAQ